MTPHSLGTLLIAGATATAAAGIVHAAPALTSIGPLRRRLWPALSGVGAPAHIALTFDDGPDPHSTPRFLRLLDRYQVHATFFLLGSMLQRSPALGREIVGAGHEIALHGWRHDLLLNRRPRDAYDDLARGRDHIAEVTGQHPRWYRPPYGVLTTAALIAARRLHLTPILWTAWGRDWTRRASARSVLRHVTRGLAPGGTILLHDSDCTAFPEAWRATLDALPTLITTVHARGMALGPLRDHGLARRDQRTR